MRQEVLLTTSSSPNSSILIHDLHTSNHIHTFRDSVVARNGVASTPHKTQILAAQEGKGLIHMYSWVKDTMTTKMILPDKIRSLKISPLGTWCVGGSETGRLFVWEVLALTDFNSFE
jgi:pre-rRNA-processing protein IPI3